MNFLLNRNERVILSIVILLGILAFAHTPLTDFFQGVLPRQSNKSDYGPRPIELENAAVRLPEMNREKTRVDLNEASPEELQSLEGVGAVLAGRIVEFREQNGSFKSIEELTEVEGIGPSKLDGFREMVEVKDGDAS